MMAISEGCVAASLLVVLYASSPLLALAVTVILGGGYYR